MPPSWLHVGPFLPSSCTFKTNKRRSVTLPWPCVFVAFYRMSSLAETHRLSGYAIIWKPWAWQSSERRRTESLSERLFCFFSKGHFFWCNISPSVWAAAVTWESTCQNCSSQLLLRKWFTVLCHIYNHLILFFAVFFWYICICFGAFPGPVLLKWNISTAWDQSMSAHNLLLVFKSKQPGIKLTFSRLQVNKHVPVLFMLVWQNECQCKSLPLWCQHFLLLQTVWGLFSDLITQLNPSLSWGSYRSPRGTGVTRTDLNLFLCLDPFFI